MQQKRTSLMLILAGLWLSPLATAAPQAADLQFFESKVRPLFATRCVSCHGASKSSAGLRLDSRAAILQGGDKGPAALEGKSPAESRLIRATRGDIQTPKFCRLKAEEIAALTHWIERGLPWTDDAQPISSDGKDHWAFQPIQQPDLPRVKNASWISTPVDTFVLAKLEQSNLHPSPEADRRTLIRRASYALTGLPPKPEEVDQFLKDPDPQAYEGLIDRLLDSEHYGEKWARHWLDVARYSDTKGYVYAREERFWAHAWPYRDWVVEALNQDLPYDRFLLLQLAADQAAGAKKSDLAAMGFLTLGRRFLGVTHDIIDDRIDVVTRGTMALTVGCTRCHDHPYDPIPTEDYYSLYGVFASSAEKQVALDQEQPGQEAFWNELKKRREALKKKTTESHQESFDRARNRIADYLKAQTELEKYPDENFGQIFSKDDLLPAFVRRWADYLHKAKLRQDPIFVPWHAYATLPQESFAEKAGKVTADLQSAAPEKIHPLVAQAFSTAPSSFQQVIDRYVELFENADQQWQAAMQKAADTKTTLPTQLPDATSESLRQVLYSAQSPCRVPDLPIVHTESFFDNGTTTALWKLQGEIDRWIIKSKVPARFALALTDHSNPVTARVFQRGNPRNLGNEVPRGFLTPLSNDLDRAFQQGSGRLELAQAIIDPSNPLTARVMVNRVWAHHFGSGLVTTPSDFGTRANAPSHPQLLDWLASHFIKEGWSLKKLHRWIVLSSTFRQSSEGPRKNTHRRLALDKDPANRLLWRMNVHRLGYEEFRDSMMASSGDLDRRIGGKPSDFFKKPYPKRRTLYGLVDRQFVPSTLRMFDFANPDLHIPKRTETTVPQQALFFMNHPLVLERARSLATFSAQQGSDEERVRTLFRQALQRNPSELEIAESLALIGASPEMSREEAPPTAKDWHYGYGSLDENTQRVKDFTPLPHFTGEAWQGGPKWPDAKLGWVQLTATGGHPGNDLKHAAIRRWKAPRSMTIGIRSQLIHEAQPGDGIRAFVISSRAGKLLSTAIHQKQEEMNLETIRVEKGETIDFVVDIGKILNSDQYLWSASVKETSDNERAIIWDSRNDFPQETIEKLTAWEQLAQALLCSNEFLFID